MRMTGMIVMVFGFGLMVLGYQFSLSAQSQIAHAVTGSYGDKVTALYIVGAISFVTGIFIFWKK